MVTCQWCILGLLLGPVLGGTLNNRMKRIIGGVPYNDGEFTFHASLWFVGENNFTATTPGMDHICGGVLIQPDWVLTAATCFEEEIEYGFSDTHNWWVVLGMHAQKEATNQATFASIESYFIPPDYGNWSGDIALIKLTEKVALSDRISLATYNTDSKCPEDGQDSYHIGWGTNQTEVWGLALNIPEVVHMPAYSREACREAYSLDYVQKEMPITIDESRVCAGRPEGGADGCFGDSGSPLLNVCDGKEVVTGIMSAGYGCAEPNFPGIFSRTSYYHDWIQQTITNNP